MNTKIKISLLAVGVPVINDPKAEIHSILFWRFPHYYNGLPGAALRSGKWKLNSTKVVSWSSENHFSNYMTWKMI